AADVVVGRGAGQRVAAPGDRAARAADEDVVADVIAGAAVEHAEAEAPVAGLEHHGVVVNAVVHAAVGAAEAVVPQRDAALVQVVHHQVVADVAVADAGKVQAGRAVDAVAFAPVVL